MTQWPVYEMFFSLTRDTHRNNNVFSNNKNNDDDRAECKHVWMENVSKYCTGTIERVIGEQKVDIFRIIVITLMINTRRTRKCSQMQIDFFINSNYRSKLTDHSILNNTITISVIFLLARLSSSLIDSMKSAKHPVCMKPLSMKTLRWTLVALSTVFWVEYDDDDAQTPLTKCFFSYSWFFC